MLHPVLPPEPPPILESLQSANPTPVLKADTKTLGNKEKSEVQRETPLQTTGQKPTDSDLLVAKTLAAPSKPESLPPEFSPITASKSAASLGDQLSIGYPLQELKGFSLRRTSKESLKQLRHQLRLTPQLKNQQLINQYK
jgi:hypothetical protein